MRNLILALTVLLFGSTAAFADTTAADEFLSLREETYAMMPESFTGKLTGTSITEKLDSIPDDYIEGSGAYVEVSFSQSDGLEIIVKNVDFLYEDLFEQYVRFFTLGPVLSTQSDSAVLARYDIEFTTSSDGMIILNLRYSGADNYFEIYFYPDSYEIFRVDYYLDEELFSSVIMQYTTVTKKKKEYSVPYKFFIKTFDGDDSALEIFEIEDISVN